MKASTKRRLANLAIIILALCGGALLGEGLVRLVMDVPVTPQMFANDPVTDFRLKPNARGRVAWPGVVTFSWTTNSRGYRATGELAVPKPPATKRILFLGDSFTFGQGVDDHETFPAQTKHQLTRLCPPTEFEVVNAGVPGFSTSQELALLEAEGLALQPDVVVLGFYGNDPQDNLVRGVHYLQGDTLVRRPVTARPHVYRVKRLVDKLPGYAWLTEHSHLLNLMRRAYISWTSADGATAPFHAVGSSEQVVQDSETSHVQADETYAWSLMRAVLHRMREATRRAGSHLVVLLIPEPADLRAVARDTVTRTDAPTVLGRMRTLCRDLGLECLDLVAWLGSRSRHVPESTIYIPGEFHFTPLGNALTAQLLAMHLRDSLGCPGG